MRRLLSLAIILVTVVTALAVTPVAQGTGEAIPPQVIDTAPVRGEELPVGGPITFTFDQPMDQASVQTALRISPLVQGALTWPSDSVAAFQPNTPLARDTAYNFTISSDAKSKAGIALRDTFTISFRTIGSLEVTKILPENDTQAVSATPLITVIFNRPVVPLGTLDEMAKQPSPITLSPDAQGQGEWLNTSIYTFRPAALQGGQKYTITVRKGLTDITGAMLEKDVVATFSVAKPQALKISVVNASNRYRSKEMQDVDRDAKVLVTFSQPMDTAATEAAFSLTSTRGDKVEGTFAWNDTRTALTFAPKTLLNYATQYVARVNGNTARSTGGSALDKDAQDTLSTVALPDLASSNPRNHETVQSYGSFTLQFTTPMKLDDMKSRIVFYPTLKIQGAYASSDGYFYYLNADFLPSTAYTATIDVNGLTDRYGTPFHVDVSTGRYSVIGTGQIQVRFTTRALEPSLGLQTLGDVGFYSAYRPSTELFAQHINLRQIDLALYSLPLQDFLRLTQEQPWQFRRTYNPSNFLRQWSVPVDSTQNATRYTLLKISAAGPGGGTAPNTFSCPGAPATRLAVGISAVVTPDDPVPLRVRNAAGLTGAVLTQLKPGMSMDIIGGPVCLDGFVWWQIRTEDGANTGWAAEGTRDSYFIGPLNPVPAPTAPLVSDTGATAPLKPGAYWLDYSSPQLRQEGRASHLMFVGTVNVTVKMGQKMFLAWVTDLKTGQPVPDVDVQFMLLDKPVGAAAKTDVNGLARLDVTGQTYALDQSLFAVVNTGAAIGVGAAHWSQGIAPYNFDVSLDTRPQNLSVYLTSDRSIYQLGQPVHFKGVIRAREDVTYRLSDYKTTLVQIFDVKGDTVYTKTLPVDEFGSFADSFTLPETAPFGTYQIIAAPGFTGQSVKDYSPTFSRSFEVAEYRLPEYKVSVSSETPQVLQGTPIKAVVDSNYYFGGPVKGADVRWQAVRHTYYGSLSYGDYGYGGEYPVGDGTGTTDEQGRFSFELPTRLDDLQQSQVFTIEATVTDQAGLQVTGSLQVIVHLGEFYINARPASFVGTASQPQTVRLSTVDWARKPKPNIDLNLKVVQVTYDQNRMNESQIAEGSVKTDGEGQSSYTFTPTESGLYKLYATGKDSSENQVMGSTYLWITGPQYVSWPLKDNRITLQADQDNYKVGDTASILIPNPFKGEAKALITVERGKMLRSTVITLPSNSMIYKVPITPDFAPNVYVSVLLIKGIDETTPAVTYVMGLTGLNVDPEQLKLHIAVTSDKPQAGPGETVQYKLKVTDYQGKPVQAEIGIALTDLASLAIKPDTNTPIDQYYYGTQRLSIRTGTSLVYNVDPRTEDIRKVLDILNKQGPAGGGGGGAGGGGGGGGGPMTVRSKFVDTPLWQPYAKTDANGEVTITVTLPDNLTQWRLDARAVTLPTGELNTTLVGQTTFDLISSKPLMVRPVTPRFYVIGDKGVLAAVVNNNTGADQDVRVRIDAKGLTVQGNVEQTARIVSDGSTRFEWPVEVQDADKVDVVFSAATADDKYTDSAKSQAGQGDDRTLPILRYEAPDTVGTGGTIGNTGGSLTEGISLPPRLNVTQGSLDIRIDPSLAASTLTALRALQNYPLQHTEMTISRLLPNVMTYRALKNLGIEDAKLRDSLTGNIDYAIQKLESEQHKDGGWGWVVTLDSDTLVTAYALIGLSEARNAGFKVDQGTLAVATTYIVGEVNQAAANLNANSTTSAMNRQAFLIYALSRAGVNSPAATRLIPFREKLSIYARAYLAMTLHKNNPQDTSATNTAIADFQSRAIVTSTGIHWQEDFQDYFNWNSNTRTTAIVLQALIELQPSLPVIPDVVRWLMIARRADAWETSQETAWAVMALTTWMQSTMELKPNYAFGVALNDKALVSDQKATPDSVDQQIKLQVAIKDLLVGQLNKLVISRTDGDGVLYYTAHLTAYLPIDQIKPLSRGLTITRAYSLVNDPARKPIQQAKAGDTIRVLLTIVVPEDRDFVVISDPIPAGTDPVNTDLATTGKIAQRQEADIVDPFLRGWGWWFFDQVELRYDRMVLYARFLPKGTYQFSYTIVGTLAGQYHVIPTTGQEVYFPEVFGRSDGTIFTILPRDGQ